MIKKKKTKTDQNQDIILANKYQLVNKIGKGAFGVIYKCVDIKYNKEYAIKLEKNTTKYPQLSYEYKLYNYLNKNSKSKNKGIPAVHFFGKVDKYNIMVMDLLGKSLEDLKQICGGTFSVKTAVLLGEQLLQRIEYLHSREFLHRDIKPDNFIMGIKEKRHFVYVIDFGLAKRFMRSKKHISYREGKDLTGTARYASINTHAGIEQSRRDDLESLGYVLLYFLRGKLPWQGMPGKNKKQKYGNIMNKKIDFALDQLCKGFPDEFIQYIQYCRLLKFTEKPDYEYLSNLFIQIMQSKGYKRDYYYDWYNQQKNSKQLEKKKRKQKEQKKQNQMQNHIKKEEQNNIQTKKKQEYGQKKAKKGQIK